MPHRIHSSVHQETHREAEKGGGGGGGGSIRKAGGSFQRSHVLYDTQSRKPYVCHQEEKKSRGHHTEQELLVPGARLCDIINAELHSPEQI